MTVNERTVGWWTGRESIPIKNMHHAHGNEIVRGYDLRVVDICVSILHCDRYIGPVSCSKDFAVREIRRKEDSFQNMICLDCKQGVGGVIGSERNSAIGSKARSILDISEPEH